jgi:hypothetical protein
MFHARALSILVAATIAGAGCNRYYGSTAGGEVVATADAAKTVVLHVQNLNPSPMELRAIVNGRSQFVGSVGGNDTTSVLLDPSWFPTGSLYVAALPANGRGRAISGPLAAGRGDRIIFTLQSALDMSNAIVRR